MKIKVMPSFSDIFPDEEKQNIKEYLSGFDKNILVEMAVILHRISGLDTAMAVLLNCFFETSDKVFRRKIEHNYHKFQISNNGDATLLNPLVCLMLIEEIIGGSFEEIRLSDEEVGVNILKSYFVLNDKYMETQNNLNISPDYDDFNRDMIFTHSFSNIDLESGDYYSYFTIQLFKGRELFKFLDSNPETKFLLNKFLEVYKLSTWQDYLLFFLPLLIGIADPLKNISFKAEEEMLDKYKILLSELSLCENSNFVSHFDFVKLREKPIYQKSRTEFIIISPIFLIEQIYNGIYFKLKKLNDESSNDFKIKNLKSILGDKFIEGVLLYQALSSLFYKNKKAIRLSGTDFKNFGFSGEPDYYIRNWNNIFLFETKDILIRAEDKTSYDFKKLKDTLKSRLGKLPNQSQGKGTYQLARNIKHILFEKPVFDKIDASKVKIYPIIVLHSNQFKAYGINHILNEWFEEDLNIEEKYNRQVKPLIVINIDTFILFRKYFLNGSLQLHELIDEFIRLKFNLRKKRSYRDFVREQEQSWESFDEFIIKIVIKRKLLRDKQFFKELCFSLHPVLSLNMNSQK